MNKYARKHKNLLTTMEVANVLGVSPGTVHNLVKRGELVAKEVHGLVRKQRLFSSSDVQAIRRKYS